MPLKGQRPVGLLQSLLFHILRYAQHLVQAPHRCGCSYALSSVGRRLCLVACHSPPGGTPGGHINCEGRHGAGSRLPRK